MLISDTHWIWDSWVADDGEYYHLFYLQAPRSLGDAGMRHLNATVGHARSPDLVEWDVLPEALAPTPGRWDDVLAFHILDPISVTVDQRGTLVANPP